MILKRAAWVAGILVVVVAGARADDNTPENLKLDEDIPSEISTAPDAQAGLTEELHLDEEAAQSTSKQTSEDEDLESEFHSALKQADEPPQVEASQPPPTEVPAPVEPPATESAPSSVVDAPPAPVDNPVPAPEPPPPVPAPVAAAEPISGDAPNAQLEQRLYQIYLKYQSKPLNDEEWADIAGDKQSEQYSVQSGDTLSDISETLFGDPHFWPKVWSMNGGITNPHLINPGDAIVFTPGTLVAAPVVAVNEMGGDRSYPPVPSLSGIEIPPPSKQYAPVLNDLPNSFRLPPTVKSQDKFDKIGFDGTLLIRQPARKSSPIFEAAVDREPQNLGEILEIAGGALKTAATYQWVFVHATTTLNPGDQLLSYHMKANSEPEVVQFEGNLTITDVVDERARVYKALVTESLDPVRVGSKVSTGRLRYVDFNSDGPSFDGRASVVGAQYDNARHLAGPGELIFLDRGAKDGFRVGTVLSLIINHKSRDESSRVKNLGQAVGLIKIVDVSENYSTALIAEASGPVYIGDVTAPREVFLSKSKTYQGAGMVDLDDDKPAKDASSSSGSSDALEEELTLDGDGAQSAPAADGSDLELDPD